MQYTDFITESDAYFLSPKKRESDAIRLLKELNRMHPEDRGEQRDLAYRRTWIMFYMYEAARGRIHVMESTDELDDF